MKTLAQVVAEHPGYKSMIRRVYNLLGKDSIPDVYHHGIDGGFPGFTYYNDTLEFHKRHRGDINRLIEEDCQDFSQDEISFVRGFRCLDRKETTSADVAKTMWGSISSRDTIVANALTWYAAETVCRWFVEDE